LNKKTKIALIDDGVNSSEFNTPQISANIEISINGFVKDIKNYGIQINSHGTICAAIIQKYLKHPDVDFISIKILDSITKRGNVNQLIYALNWCIDNNVDVINCSFGTIEHTDFNIVRDIINKTAEKRIVIVSAINNRNIYSLPACLYNVIGVKNNFLYNNGAFKLRWHSFDDTEIVTSGVHELRKNNNEVFKTPTANSYAAPVITAFVSDCIFENGKLSYDEILLKLESNAKIVIGEYTPLNPYIWNVSDDKYETILDKWNYNEYNNIISKYLKSVTKEIDVPIINIYGASRRVCIDFIFSLLKKLKEYDFYYRIITEYVEELKYGFIVFPKNYDKLTFCSDIYYKFKNEILVLHLFDKFNCDVNIEINNTITISCYDSNISKIFHLYSLDESIHYLFEILLENNKSSS